MTLHGFNTVRIGGVGERAPREAQRLEGRSSWVFAIA